MLHALSYAWCYWLLLPLAFLLLRGLLRVPTRPVPADLDLRNPAKTYTALAAMAAAVTFLAALCLLLAAHLLFFR
jgi:hypothetical protein